MARTVPAMLVLLVAAVVNAATAGALLAYAPAAIPRAPSSATVSGEKAVACRRQRARLPGAGIVPGTIRPRQDADVTLPRLPGRRRAQPPEKKNCRQPHDLHQREQQQQQQQQQQR